VKGALMTELCYKIEKKIFFFTGGWCHFKTMTWQKLSRLCIIQTGKPILQVVLV
jgi:hypothetical protein